MKAIRLFLVASILGPALSADAALITATGQAVLDVSGNFAVGYSGSNSFIYNIATRTQVNYSQFSFSGIFGDLVVGAERATGLGVVYRMSTGTWTTFSIPFTNRVWGSADIYGTKIVGYYEDISEFNHGFIYDFSLNTWSTLDYPGASAMQLTGIWENKIVGLAYGIGGVLYDLNTSQWTLLPLEPNGISGNNIAGWKSGPPTFGSTVYNLASGTYFNPLITAQVPPGQLVTGWEVNDYSNGIAVGTYSYFNGRFNNSTGYIYVVPEASTFLLVGFALATLALLRRRQAH